jgi:selenocysteine lyase/cysteine desulfurase
MRGMDCIRDHEIKLASALIDGLSGIKGISVYGTLDAARSMPVVSITVEGKRVSEIGQRLDDEYDILSRVGLHCAPAAHGTIGTFPEGTVRLAPGVMSTRDDITKTIKAIESVTIS